VIAAARDGEIQILKKQAVAASFILYKEKITDEGLDSVETFRLKGRKIPDAQRRVYKTIGGSAASRPELTIFGEVIKGWMFVDSIAAEPT